MINKNSKIFLAGHKGLVGSGILGYLEICGYKKVSIKKTKTLRGHYSIMALFRAK